MELLSFDCYPVFLDRELSQKFYQGEVLMLSASSVSPGLWLAHDRSQQGRQMQEHLPLAMPLTCLPA